MFEQLLQPCTLITRAPSGETDDYGDDVIEEDEVETVCAIQQRDRREPGDAGENSISDWIGFFLAGEMLDTASAVEQDGRKFEFVGEPWPVINHRTGVVHHIEASLRRA